MGRSSVHEGQPELRFETGDTWENIAADLAGAIDALDKHLSDGGLLPVEWGLAGTSPTRG